MNRTKQLGWGVTGVSLIVLVLLVAVFVQSERNRQEACELACGDASQCGMASCPYQERNAIGYLVWVVGLLVAGLAGAGIYLLTSGERIITEKTYDISKLTDEERQAFLAIRESEGGIYQSTLAKQLDISKVRMTRILDTLERNDLVERKRRGMTNLIVVR